MSKPCIGVFGSAFDPPTLGHQDVLQQAAAHFDKILLVPSASHAFNKKSQPFSIRVEMLKHFAQEAEVDTVLEVCELEAQLLENNPQKPVYTFDLLSALEHLYQGDVQLSFIRGSDNANPDVWRRFYKAKDIEQRWSLFTARERITARSSKVRALLKSATSADKQNSLDKYLLPSIKHFIQQHKLYQGNP